MVQRSLNILESWNYTGILCILEDSWKIPEISELASNLSFFHFEKSQREKKEIKEELCLSINFSLKMQ